MARAASSSHAESGVAPETRQQQLALAPTQLIAGNASTTQRVLSLQRAVGNRAVGRYLHRRSGVLRQSPAERPHTSRVTGRLLQRNDLTATRAGASVSFWFSVRISSRLDSERLLLEVIRQYRGLANNEQAEEVRDREHWRWSATPPTVTDAHLRRGYILVRLRDRSITAPSPAEQRERGRYFRRLAPGEQAGLNAETDRLFWERTHYRMGQALGQSADDRRAATYWRVLRDELIRKRQAIEQLPPHVRTFLFDESAARVLAPADYDAVLRIGGKLAALSAAELADYAATVNRETNDWAQLESSVDRYVADLADRRRAAREREQLKTRLYGLEELYRRVRSFRAMERSARSIPSRDEFGVRDPSRPLIDQSVREEGRRLALELARHGFASIEDFELTIRAYRTEFERETRAVAGDMLDRYEHVLFEEERRYRNPEAAAALYERLSRTHAMQYYEEAQRQRRLASNIRPDPDLHRYLPGDRELIQAARQRGEEARRRAEAEVAGIARAHPLVSNRDFDREQLAFAEQGRVQSLMLEYIRARRRDIAETRRNLESNPDLIYELDELLGASYDAQDIRRGSISDLIIQDRRSQIHSERAMVNMAIAVLAIAAGLVTAGGGAIAVVGAATAFGLSTYQAIEEYRQFEVRSAAHGAQLLSDDPSFAWVIVAVVGAAADLGAAAAAVRAMRPAVQAFNATGDVGALRQRLAALSEIQESIRANVVRAAEAELEARRAWSSLFRPPAVLRAVIVPGAEEFGRLVYAVYLTIKRGIIGFERFVKTREAMDLIGDIARFSPEDLTSLKAAFTEAIAASERVAAHGTSLGMNADQIHAFVRMWHETGGMTAERLLEHMDAWVAVQRSGIPWGFRDAEHFAAFRETARRELERVVRRSDRAAQAYLQGSAGTGISYSRQLPFGPHSDLDIAISSEYLFRQAERTHGLEVALSPRRIGPLSDEQIDALGLSRLHDRLARVLEEEGGTGRVINFMLFENPRAVTAPIGSHSRETTRAAVPLL